MTTLVLTVLGDDQTGLVDRISGIVSRHDGNWDTSHMARLAGKFAGIVMVSVPAATADDLIAELQQLETEQLLHVTVERVAQEPPATPATMLSLDLVGQDHPGIVHDISRVLANHEVSIEELRTQTVDAPMAGGTMFKANAVLRAPADVSVDDLFDQLEELASDLMVDIDLEDEAAD